MMLEDGVGLDLERVKPGSRRAHLRDNSLFNFLWSTDLVNRRK